MNKNFPLSNVNLGSLQKNPNSISYVSSRTDRIFVNNNPVLLDRMIHPGPDVTPAFENALIGYSSRHNHSLNDFKQLESDPHVIFTPHPNADISKKKLKDLSDLYIRPEGVKTVPKLKIHASAAVLGFTKPKSISYKTTKVPLITHPYKSPSRHQVTEIYKTQLPTTMPSEFTTRISAIKTSLIHITIANEVQYLATLLPTREYHQFLSYLYYLGTCLNFYNINPRNLRSDARGLYSRFDDYEESDYIYYGDNKGLRGLVDNTMRKLPNRHAYGDETFFQVKDYCPSIFNDTITMNSRHFIGLYKFFFLHSINYAHKFILPELIKNGYNFDFENNVAQDPYNKKLPVDLTIFDKSLYPQLRYYHYSNHRTYNHIMDRAAPFLDRFSITTLYFYAFRITAQNPLSINPVSLKYSRGLYKYILNHNHKPQ